METTVTTIYLFKGLVILVGLAFVYMGYKLFIKGITAPAGSFTGEVGDKKLKLVRFAPGIFFALVGSVVVVVGSTRQFSISMPDGTPTDSKGAMSRTADDTGMLELESAGNPPTEETDAAPTEPSIGTGTQSDHGDQSSGGHRDGRGHAASGLITICDTCDVR